LWVATLSGLSAISAGLVHTYIDAPGLGSTYIYDVGSYGGGVYVATDGKGVFRFRDGAFIPVPCKQGELDEATAYNFASSGDSLWCITREQGIFHYRELDGAFVPYGGLASTGFSSFGASSQGNLLVLNEDGLTVISDSTRLVFSPEDFGSSEAGSYLQTFGRSGDGVVFFSSGSSVYTYAQAGELAMPEVFLHRWEVNFEAVSPRNTHLDADAVNHNFTLGTSWFAGARNQSFSYKLNGIDQAFKSSRSGDISYPNLPYGSYELLARPGYNGIYYGAPVSLISFSIARPFYLTAWFIALVVVGVIGLVLLIVRIRVGQVNRARLSEKRLVETELAVLRNQINPHFLFNSFNTLLNMIETHPEKAGSYLQKLSDFYRRMLDKRSDQVVTLGEELDVLREYVYLQQQRFGKALGVEIDVGAETRKTKIPALTLQLLLENAIKHNVVSASAPLDVRIFKDNGFLVVRNRVAPKHKPEPGTGTGLDNILSRYRALFNAEVQVEATAEFFTVYLPIISP
ncbi:MAG TPA: histidine kinase, partial [Cryomorphaceae bacterium]|nr:histidine kinase [Cryomorphaceae bacterium]